MNWISASAYIFAIALVKISLLVLYLRTFTVKGFFRTILWSVLVAIILTHAQVVILYYAKLDPFVCIWKYGTLPSALWNVFCRTRIEQLKNWVFISIFTVILDIIVLVLPIRVVWNLQMAKRQKTAVSILIGAGAM